MASQRIEGFLSAFHSLNQLPNHNSVFSWFSLPQSSLPLPQHLESFYAPAQGSGVRRVQYRLLQLADWKDLTRRVLPWLLHFAPCDEQSDCVGDAFHDHLKEALGGQRPLFWMVDQRASQVNPVGDVGWDLFLFELPVQTWALYCGWSD
ncbi:MAG: hypothetical protein U0931_29525 [Vulcanimicrobiota bacterium]